MLPCRWATFVFPLLGAIALERWFSRRRNLRELLWVLPVVLAAVLLVAWPYYFSIRLMRQVGVLEYVQTQIWVAAGIAGLCLVLFALSCIWHRPTLWAGLLTLVLAADLIAAVRGILPTCPLEELFIKTKLTDFLLEQEKPCRVAVGMGLIPGGIMPIYGIEQWTGYDGLYPERAKRFQEDLGPDIWNSMAPACAVRYYLHASHIGETLFPRDRLGYFNLVAEHEGIEVYENTAAFPRAYLVGKARIVEDTDAMFDIMRSEEFDPSHEVLLEAAPGAALPSASTADLGSARITEWASTDVRVEATAAEPCVLVLGGCLLSRLESLCGRPSRRVVSC